MALVGGGGSVRGGEQRRGRSEGEREIEPGAAWRSVAWIRTKGSLQREAGGGRGSRARATPRLCSSSWQRRKTTRGRRWAGPARWAGQLGHWRSWAGSGGLHG